MFMKFSWRKVICLSGTIQDGINLMSIIGRLVRSPYTKGRTALAAKYIETRITDQEIKESRNLSAIVSLKKNS